MVFMPNIHKIFFSGIFGIFIFIPFENLFYKKSQKSIKFVAIMDDVTQSIPKGSELAQLKQHSDSEVITTVPILATTKLCMNEIPEGVNDDERVGRSILIRSIAVKGYVELNSQTGVSFNSVSLWVVLDRDSKGIDLAAKPVAFATGAVGEICNSDFLPISFLNAHNGGRYEVLKAINIDIGNPGIMYFGGTGVWAYNSKVKTFDFMLDCDVKINYNNADGRYDHVVGNNLYVVVGSTHSSNVQMVYQFQVLYEDL